MKYLNHYLNQVAVDKRSAAAISYLAALDAISETSKEIPEAILRELKSQRSTLKMIASENYSSLAVQLAMGNLMTDKYAEGFPFHRFYAGCENVDTIEDKAVKLAQSLFKADHAYVQPHSGADANLIAFWSILTHKIQDPALEKLGKKSVAALTAEEHEVIRQKLINQKVLGMSLSSGGHLTHGYKLNVSSKMMQAISYEVDPKTHLIDYKALEAQAIRERPLILIAGYSAYSRLIDFSKMKEIAERAGAVLMVDMAHFAGLVAGGVMTGVYNPVAYADVVTSTTHKTLRGPRGGLVLCKEPYKASIDKGCPLVIGGPLPHVMAAKVISFEEASLDSFKVYAAQIVKNAKALAEALLKRGVKLITGGTDNHLVLLDIKSSFGLNGRQAEHALREVGITSNRNTIPFDENGPWFTSGVRLGTAALTTRGLKEEEMAKIGGWIVDILKATSPKPLANSNDLSQNEANVEPALFKRVQAQIAEMLEGFPLYNDLIVD
jgi:glycine hydroxymethyltransferase